MPPWKHARGRQKPEVEHRPAVNIAGEKMGCSGTLGLLKSSSDFPGSFLYACRGGKGDRRAALESTSECQKSGGAGGTASCRGYRGGAPNSCAAALSPQTSLRVRSTEDEDSPKGYRSPKPAMRSRAGRKALFAGNGGQLGGVRQTAALESVFSLAQTEGIVFFHRIKDFEIDF